MIALSGKDRCLENLFENGKTLDFISIPVLVGHFAIISSFIVSLYF